MERVIAYIDGFNLYHGLKAENWRRYYWLDIVKVCDSLVTGNQTILEAKYFTARITAPEDKRKRQLTYLEALETLERLSIVYGRYDTKEMDCNRCNRVFNVPNEKMTDVNLAVEMMDDAFHNKFDTAYLISGDSDLTPPLIKIKKHFSHKKIITWFPPKRYADSLKRASDRSGFLGRALLASCLLPEQIEKQDGFLLTRPLTWI